MTCLVTGGCGFIGSHVCEALISRGEKVRVLDDLSTGSLDNLSALHGRVELVEGDIRDGKTVASAMKGVTRVCHLAALVLVADSVRRPADTHSINVDGTFRLLFQAKEEGVARFVMASTSSIYGNRPELPKHEDMQPAPESPYALSKLIGEHYCRLFSSLYGLPTACLRYFNVYGPRQDPSSEYSGVIAKFADNVARGRAPVIHGDGTQSRDFIFVKDVAEATARALFAPGLGRGEAVNVGTGRRVSVNEVYEAIRELARSTREADHGPERPGDVKHLVADVTRARELLQWSAERVFPEGLAETLSLAGA
ncbi:MAG: SDR family oxidoreductase [Thermodesulfobacteriota bacterium]